MLHKNPKRCVKQFIAKDNAYSFQGNAYTYLMCIKDTQVLLEKF